MRLLFLSTVYPTPWEPGNGPANRSTAESLRALGCEVAVVAPVPWPRRLLHKKRSAPPGDYPTYWYSPGTLRRFYHLPLWWSIASTLKRISRDFQPEAVLAVWTHPDGTVAVRYAKSLGIPCSIIVGGSDVMLLPRSPSRRRVVADTLQRADHVFAVGRELERRVIGLGVKPERVSNFFRGVNLNAFIPGDKRAAREQLDLPLAGEILLWIGSMVPVKAAHRLLVAAAQLLPNHPDLQVVMIGDGPERGALSTLAERDATLRGRVHFPGAVGPATLPLWYRAADLFVLPSKSEGVPNVLLEAMAMGLPFVASDVGSISDLLPFGPSRVVPEGDLGALTGAIASVLQQAGQAPIAPKRYDRLDGARHLLEYVGKVRA